MIRIVLEGLRGEQSVADLCRREGIASNLYSRWTKDVLGAGKKLFAGDTLREATSDDVKDLRAEHRELKEVVAEITLEPAANRHPAQHVLRLVREFPVRGVRRASR